MVIKPDKSPKTDLSVRRKRLKFQAWHRGTKEADLVLGQFVDKHLKGFTAADLDWFDALMREADQDILNWVLGKTPPPPEFDTPMMACLKALKHMNK